jgi:hypothetical protein
MAENGEDVGTAGSLFVRRSDNGHTATPDRRPPQMTPRYLPRPVLAPGSWKTEAPLSRPALIQSHHSHLTKDERPRRHDPGANGPANTSGGTPPSALDGATDLGAHVSFRPWLRMHRPVESSRTGAPRTKSRASFSRRYSIFQPRVLNSRSLFVARARSAASTLLDASGADLPAEPPLLEGVEVAIQRRTRVGGLRLQGDALPNPHGHVSPH